MLSAGICQGDLSVLLLIGGRGLGRYNILLTITGRYPTSFETLLHLLQSLSSVDAGAEHVSGGLREVSSVPADQSESEF